MSKGKVYFKNEQVGQIEKNSDGSFSLQYLQEAKSVSWTLPTTHLNYNSEELFPFFDGLIPEGWLLNLAEKNWKIPKNDRMTLLLTTCQDCIGAAHVLGEDQQSNDIKSDQKNLLDNSAFFESKKTDRCLICLQDLKDENLYHKKCAQNLFGFSHAPMIDISTKEMDQLALRQINQRLTLTGVQKKLSLSPIKDEKKDRLTVVGLDGRFILKPSTEEYPEMAEIEHVSMKLAELQQIPVAKCGLVYLADGERAYITKRFDRNENEKIQMEDFCQLSEKSTQKKYSGSSESLGKVIDKYSSIPQDDKLTLFQMILFSFWIGNADMHLKNFSLWMDPDSNLVRMSPGYDFISTRLLIPAEEDNEELALPVNGRKNKLKWTDFLAFGSNLKIPTKVMERVRDKMLSSTEEAVSLIERSFLSQHQKENFQKLIEVRSNRLK